MLSRLIRFALVGAVATGVQYAILIALVRGGGMWPPAASALGFSVSACANYLMNYHFTFRSRRPHIPAAARFAVLSCVGLALNWLMMQILVGAGWHYLLAQVCATGLVVLWNFTGNSVWTFGSRQARC